MTDIISSQSRLSVLTEKSKDYMSASIADSTKRSYRQDFAQFSAFCEKNDLQSLPAHPDTLILYLSHMADIGRKKSTITRAVTGISQIHIAAGYPRPVNEATHKVLAGIRRSDRKPSKKAKPITLSLLRLMIQTITPDFIGIRNKALLALGWSGALRRSEIVSLQKDDIDLVDDGLIVTIRGSKTDKESHGYSIGIPWSKEDLICPVQALNKWLSIGQIYEGPIFRSLGARSRNMLIDIPSDKSLRPRMVSHIVKQHASFAGLNPHDYSGHSLRSGFITEAAERGISERVIMRHTRHNSVVVMRGYIHDGSLFRDNPLGSIYGS